jgi:hypothetical protein
VSDKYEGQIGPADAMSALDDRFHSAYSTATAQIMGAVTEFERATGRVVGNVSLEMVDITRLADVERRSVRLAQIHFLPKPDEVAW